MKKWHKVVIIVFLVLALDGVKAYFMARHATRGDKFKTMGFVGVWYVSFWDTSGKITPVETIIVAPLLPIIISKSLTK